MISKHWSLIWMGEVWIIAISYDDADVHNYKWIKLQLPLQQVQQLWTSLCDQLRLWSALTKSGYCTVSFHTELMLFKFSVLYNALQSRLGWHSSWSACSYLTRDPVLKPHWFSCTIANWNIYSELQHTPIEVFHWYHFEFYSSKLVAVQLNWISKLFLQWLHRQVSLATCFYSILCDTEWQWTDLTVVPHFWCPEGLKLTITLVKMLATLRSFCFLADHNILFPCMRLKIQFDFSDQTPAMSTQTWKILAE